MDINLYLFNGAFNIYPLVFLQTKIKDYDKGRKILFEEITTCHDIIIVGSYAEYFLLTIETRCCKKVVK